MPLETFEEVEDSHYFEGIARGLRKTEAHHTNRTYNEMLDCEKAYKNGDISKQLYHATIGHWPNDLDVKKKTM